MIFLIEYNRREGRIVTFRKFDDAQRQEAAAERFNIELDLHRKGVAHEVVLLEAYSEADVRRTHRRYFEDFSELVRLPASGADH